MSTRFVLKMETQDDLSISGVTVEKPHLGHAVPILKVLKQQGQFFYFCSTRKTFRFEVKTYENMNR